MRPPRIRTAWRRPAALGSAPAIHCQKPRSVSVLLKRMSLIWSTARPIWRVVKMSIATQQIRRAHATTAIDLTGLRKRNIQTRSWRVDFSAPSPSRGARGVSDSVAGSLDPEAGVVRAVGLGAVDCVLDTVF